MTYDEIGGQEVINRLVEDFYEIMRTDPGAKNCLATHAGKDLNDSAQKLKYFLSGWLGGPPLYLEHYGHPRLRMRHHPFPISPVEAQEWLHCMHAALGKSNIPEKNKSEMLDAFKQVALIVINRNP
jgi:hemoglobin